MLQKKLYGKKQLEEIAAKLSSSIQAPLSERMGIIVEEDNEVNASFLEATFGVDELPLHCPTTFLFSWVCTWCP